MIRFIITLFALQLCLFNTVIGQSSYPPTINSDKTEVYKSIGNIDLRLWVFEPYEHQPSDKKPAIIFFFGGGWQKGNPKEFEEHCRYVAKRGMVGIIADFRMINRNNTKGKECVTDAKSVIRWVRQHAADLGVDPNRIVASGASSGGHMAACTAMLEGFEEASEDLTISAKPNALVLFNPALVLSSIPKHKVPAGLVASYKRILGMEPKLVSPYNFIKPGICPTIIFHGTEDIPVSYNTAVQFTERMKQMNNSCTLIGYEGVGHGFHQYGRNNNAGFIATVYKMDEFLVSLGYLTAPPKRK